MPLYHIVLFRLKPTVTVETLEEFKSSARAMVSKVPGLIKLEINRPLPDTAYRSQGFNMGLVAILEKAEDLPGYTTHPAHSRVHELRESVADGESLAYDLEFPA
ncbi:hypothetical protein F4811DRAFT_260431 [Daldinia bambusicola]|nr:hypothetical protein F4811DRAFT_260431 [Daldinia bambusicola]